MSPKANLSLRDFIRTHNVVPPLSCSCFILDFFNYSFTSKFGWLFLDKSIQFWVLCRMPTENKNIFFPYQHCFVSAEAEGGFVDQVRLFHSFDTSLKTEDFILRLPDLNSPAWSRTTVRQISMFSLHSLAVKKSFLPWSTFQVYQTIALYSNFKNCDSSHSSFVFPFFSKFYERTRRTWVFKAKARFWICWMRSASFIWIAFMSRLFVHWRFCFWSIEHEKAVVVDATQLGMRFKSAGIICSIALILTHGVDVIAAAEGKTWPQIIKVHQWKEALIGSVHGSQPWWVEWVGANFTK